MEIKDRELVCILKLIRKMVGKVFGTTTNYSYHKLLT